MNKTVIINLIVFILSGISSFAQEKTSTLFPYPQVPDTISTLENRSNYFVSHFWDKFDFGKQIKDIDKFEEAFKDYITFFQYAHRTVVRTSINDLMNKAQSNTKNFTTLAELAQKNLYDAGAFLKSDEAYMLFATNIIKSSKLKKIEKERYERLIVKINSNQQGMPAPSFEYIDLNGDKKSFNDLNAENILLFFNDPECEDCSISRLRLSTNVAINKLIDDGKLIIVSIYPGKYSKEWAEKAHTYSSKWVIGAFEDADEIYDLRIIPNLYFLDKDKKIITKNISVNDLIDSING